MKKLYLVDGHSYLYRAFYAIRNLSTRQGIPTGAVFGFINMMLKIIEEHPDMLIVTFDSPVPSFRVKKYSEYKIHRKPMPDDLISQIPVIKEMLDALNIYRIEMPGFEADDILASISRKAEKEGIEEIVIFSNDKDILQLVNEHISVQTESVTPIKYTPPEVITRFGNPPDRIPDILALTGDASDNIPGVPGIGPKTAIKLIQEFKTLNNLLNSLAMVESKKVQALLQKYIDSARLSFELINLNIDPPINIDFKECIIKEFDYDKLKVLLNKLEFTTLARKLIPDEENKPEYIIINNMESFFLEMGSLSKVSEFSFDIASYGSNTMDIQLAGIAFCISKNKGFYVPFSQNLLDMSYQLDLNKMLIEIKSIFENPDIKKIGHNIKSNLIIFHKYGINPKNITFDTSLASYVLNPSRRTHEITELAMEYLSVNIISPDKLTGKGRKEISWGEVDKNSAGQYFCGNADVIFQLKQLLAEKLEQENLLSLFYQIEMPLIPVLAKMEMQGIRLDVNYINKIKQEVDFMLKKYEKDIFATSVEILEELALTHELPILVLNYRQLAKLSSTYVDALPEMVNPDTGRLHTSFNQTITATGRLSSSNPNLQNIPIRSEFGRLIRGAFIAPADDWKLISGDYSQIELRLLAHFSKDKNLMKAFLEGEDIHVRTACELFNITPDKVDDNLRRIAKTINFGIVYGMSPYGLARDLKIDREKASLYIDNYFIQYPEVKKFIDYIISETREKGYVTTLLGRKRYISELISEARGIQDFGERIAVNTPLQGTAADLIKIAMIRIDNELMARNLRTKMILQIHDELIFESPDEEVDSVSILIKDIMEHALILDVPIKVDIKIGNSWLEIY
ncbi:DNA polymerase I [Candidatus Desantisbacteria bacterium]|nr:DNA polymerase I [Candidatus Desantisbacteria bacterium]